jgi:hypothetical protein
MSTVGIIGCGNVGGSLARLEVASGHDVVLSKSRRPDTLGDLVARLGPQARAATPREAASAGEIILVSVPLKAYPALSGVPVAGKAVKDTGTRPHPLDERGLGDRSRHSRPTQSAMSTAAVYVPDPTTPADDRASAVRRLEVAEMA